jgi:hypothetical protein
MSAETSPAIVSSAVASTVPAVSQTVKRGRGRPKAILCQTEGGIELSIKEANVHDPTHTLARKDGKPVAETAGFKQKTVAPVATPATVAPVETQVA